MGAAILKVSLAMSRAYDMGRDARHMMVPWVQARFHLAASKQTRACCFCLYIRVSFVSRLRQGDNHHCLLFPWQLKSDALQSSFLVSDFRNKDMAKLYYNGSTFYRAWCRLCMIARSVFFIARNHRLGFPSTVDPCAPSSQSSNSIVMKELMRCLTTPPDRQTLHPSSCCGLLTDSFLYQV